MAWSIEQYESVEALLRRLGELGQRSLVFRGQTLPHGFSLYPRVDRLLMGTRTSQRQRHVLELYAMKMFKSFARDFASASESQMMEQEGVPLLCFMRHYGSPTRLLDWTASPFVAAFHASNDDLDNCEPAVVYAVGHFRLNELVPHDCRPLTECLDVLVGSLLDKPFVVWVDSFVRNARMIAQQGSFTIAGTLGADHAALIDRAIPDDEAKRFKIRLQFPSAMKRELLARLAQMNITQASLYPGLDGIGAHLAHTLSCALEHPQVHAAISAEGLASPQQLRDKAAGMRRLAEITERMASDLESGRWQAPA